VGQKRSPVHAFACHGGHLTGQTAIGAAAAGAGILALCTPAHGARGRQDGNPPHEQPACAELRSPPRPRYRFAPQWNILSAM